MNLKFPLIRILALTSGCLSLLLQGCEGMAVEAKNKQMISAHRRGKINDQQFAQWQAKYAHWSAKYELEMQLSAKPSEQLYRYWESTGRDTEKVKQILVQQNPALRDIYYTSSSSPTLRQTADRTMGPQVSNEVFAAKADFAEMSNASKSGIAADGRQVNSSRQWRSGLEVSQETAKRPAEFPVPFDPRRHLGDEVIPPSPAAKGRATPTTPVIRFDD